jgi:hypothetical protein
MERRAESYNAFPRRSAIYNNRQIKIIFDWKQIKGDLIEVLVKVG